MQHCPSCNREDLRTATISRESKCAWYDRQESMASASTTLQQCFASLITAQGVDEYYDCHEHCAQIGTLPYCSAAPSEQISSSSMASLVSPCVRELLIRIYRRWQTYACIWYVTHAIHTVPSTISKSRAGYLGT